MKEIELNKFKKNKNITTLVDDEDYDFLNQYNWFSVIYRNLYYVKRKTKINNKWCCISMHRMIMNAKKNQIVDHIDGNPLNNQKYNLRFVNYSQNSMNQRAYGKCKYKGVSLRIEKRNLIKKSFGIYQRYTASIRINGKLIDLGSFKTEIEAAIAYNNAAIKYHGEFARLNIIPQTEDLTIEVFEK